jgi:hypothetical protein
MYRRVVHVQERERERVVHVARERAVCVWRERERAV